MIKNNNSQAIKLARAATGKQNVIAFDNSFHGRTMGAMALTNSKTYYRKGFGPLMGGAFASRYPYCLRCSARKSAPDGDTWYKLAPNVPPLGDPYESRKCCQEPLDALRWLLKQQTAPEETAAVIVEPILGEGGFLTPPPGFLDGVRRICDEHGILLILDEVQAGVARSGTFWAHEQLMSPGEKTAADILVFAKGIASGFPFAGIASRPELHEGLTPGTFGGTYGANALGCAAAAATLDVIADEGLVENARERGKQLAAGLVKIASDASVVPPGTIVDVRGRGLMAAVEFGAGGGGNDAKEAVFGGPARAGVASAVAAACGERGMLLMTAGARESVRFLPALTVSAEEIDEALSIFEAALGDVF